MREEEGVLPLPSLMEAWRAPVGGKRTLRGAYVRIKPGGSGSGAARPMSMGQAEARAKLERIVRKAPEVMVKVSGKQYGAQHVAEHFGYVARHGKLAVRSSEGEIITEPDRLKAIAQDWAMLDEAMNEHGRERPTSMSLVRGTRNRRSWLRSRARSWQLSRRCRRRIVTPSASWLKRSSRVL